MTVDEMHAECRATTKGMCLTHNSPWFAGDERCNRMMTPRKQPKSVVPFTLNELYELRRRIDVTINWMEEKLNEQEMEREKDVSHKDSEAEARQSSEVRQPSDRSGKQEAKSSVTCTCRDPRNPGRLMLREDFECPVHGFDAKAGYGEGVLK